MRLRDYISEAVTGKKYRRAPILREKDIDSTESFTDWLEELGMVKVREFSSRRKAPGFVSEYMTEKVNGYDGKTFDYIYVRFTGLDTNTYEGRIAILEDGTVYSVSLGIYTGNHKIFNLFDIVNSKEIVNSKFSYLTHKTVDDALEFIATHIKYKNS